MNTRTVRQALLDNLAPGIEEFPNGKPVFEIEYTIYAELPDLGCLNAAYKKEEHEQWKVPFAKEGDMRARIRCVNGREWQYTTKTVSDEWVGSKEITTTITKEAFEEHKRNVACDGYNKTRYSYRTEVEGVEWEVDVFTAKNSGKPSLWVKIDLEVKDLNQAIPKLPFKTSSLIIADREGMALSEKAMIRSLWENEWARLDDDNAIQAELDTPNSFRPSEEPQRL